MISDNLKDFYSNFFEELETFDLKDSREDENNFYAIISPVKCVHPVDIQVVIPKEYPYKKITLWTDSLYGYPHLIYNKDLHKSWFCLNTPFAETAESQLKIDIEKLTDWFKQMMHEELPARIQNGTLCQALRFASAYSWEFYNNSEYNSDSGLIFIGDFAENHKNFLEQGKLYCKSVEIDEYQRRFYAFETQFPGCVELPYIVVDSMCPEYYSLKAMQEYYGWDASVWNKLLPVLHVNEIYRPTELIFEENLKFKLEDIDRHLKETEIPEEYRWIVEDRIELLKSHTTDVMISTTFPPENDPFPTNELVEGKSFEAKWLVSRIQLFYKKQFYFAICVDRQDNLKWYLFSTSMENEILNNHIHKIGNLNIQINELLDVRLDYNRASVTDFEHFFGRGSAPSALINSKIAVIGAGAIGSLLMESLVRSGIRHITVWDGDHVEPGNICRSVYTLNDVGRNKAIAIADYLKSISPFCDVIAYDSNLYGDINYSSQSDIAAQLKDFDIIFDCTASNELLHFLSYSMPSRLLYSLCITNRAQNLLCLSSKNGNIFEQRKAFLSAIEQDTNNFYVEGTGCYSPTFLATKSSISSLLDSFCNSLFMKYANNEQQCSVIYNKDMNSVIEDNILTLKLKDSSIRLNIFDSVLSSVNRIPESSDYAIGYLLGGYSEDRKDIYITNVVSSEGAIEDLDRIYSLTEGVIDYIGEIHYADEKGHLCHDEIVDSLTSKAQDPTINTNNPLIATRRPDGSIDFYLFCEGRLVPFY